MLCDVAKEQEQDLQAYATDGVLSYMYDNLDIDSSAQSLYPDDEEKNVLPVQVYGDGNCAYRSLSVLCFGHQRFHEEIRVKTVIEMALNKEHYLNDVMLGEQDGRSTVRRLAQTSGSGSNGSLNDIYEKEVLKSCRNGHWAGIWQLCAFSSVSGHPIRSIYPAANALVRADLHRTIEPRPSKKRSADEYKIMWTKMGCYGKHHLQGWWKPDHFVPCLKRDRVRLNSKNTDKTPGNEFPNKTTTGRRSFTLADFISTKKSKKNCKSTGDANKKYSNEFEVKTKSEDIQKSDCSQHAQEGKTNMVNTSREDPRCIHTSVQKGQSTTDSKFQNLVTSEEREANVQQQPEGKQFTISDFLAGKKIHKNELETRKSCDFQQSKTLQENPHSTCKKPCIDDTVQEKSLSQNRTSEKKKTHLKYPFSIFQNANVSQSASPSSSPSTETPKRNSDGLQRIKTSGDGALLVTPAKRAKRKKEATSVKKMGNMRAFLKPVGKENVFSEEQNVNTIKKQNTSNTSDKHEETALESVIMPLSVSKKWYRKQGKVLASNWSRMIRRDRCGIKDSENDSIIGMQRSTVEISLKESLNRINELMNSCPSPSIKQYANLAAVKAVANELLEGSPILPTQKASHIFQCTKNKILSRDSAEIVNRTAMHTYETLAKYMPITQVYVNQNAYIMEDRGDKLASVVEDIYRLTASHNFNTLLMTMLRGK